MSLQRLHNSHKIKFQDSTLHKKRQNFYQSIINQRKWKFKSSIRQLFKLSNSTNPSQNLPPHPINSKRIQQHRQSPILLPNQVLPPFPQQQNSFHKIHSNQQYNPLNHKIIIEQANKIQMPQNHIQSNLIDNFLPKDGNAQKMIDQNISMQNQQILIKLYKNCNNSFQNQTKRYNHQMQPKLSYNRNYNYFPIQSNFNNHLNINQREFKYLEKNEPCKQNDPSSFQKQKYNCTHKYSDNNNFQILKKDNINFKEKKKQLLNFQYSNELLSKMMNKINNQKQLLKKQKQDHQQLKDLFQQKQNKYNKIIGLQDYAGFSIIKTYKNYIIFNKVLGKGTFATVYEGINKVNGQKIAVKQISSKKIKNYCEVECLKKLNNKYIISFYDYFVDDKHLYMILEYCSQNLAQRIQKLQKDSISEKSKLKKKIIYGQMLIEGMNYLYMYSFLHRDLKFQNVLVKDDTLKIGDFGLARKLNKNLQLQSVRCGTPYTMAPEIYFHPKQADQNPKYSYKADIFSLSVMLHQLFYKQHPFNFQIQKLKDLQRQNVKQKLNKYKCEFQIDIKWVEEIIEKGLKRVQQRISWQQVMQIYKKYKTGKKNQQHQQVSQKYINQGLLSNRLKTKEIKYVQITKKQEKTIKKQQQQYITKIKEIKNINIEEKAVNYQMKKARDMQVQQGRDKATKKEKEGRMFSKGSKKIDLSNLDLGQKKNSQGEFDISREYRIFFKAKRQNQNNEQKFDLDKVFKIQRQKARKENLERQKANQKKRINEGSQINNQMMKNCKVQKRKSDNVITQRVQSKAVYQQSELNRENKRREEQIKEQREDQEISLTSILTISLLLIIGISGLLNIERLWELRGAMMDSMNELVSMMEVSSSGFLIKSAFTKIMGYLN